MDELVDWADLVALHIFALHLKNWHDAVKPVQEAIRWIDCVGADEDFCVSIAKAVRETASQPTS